MTDVQLLNRLIWLFVAFQALRLLYYGILYLWTLFEEKLSERRWKKKMAQMPDSNPNLLLDNYLHIVAGTYEIQSGFNPNNRQEVN